MLVKINRIYERVFVTAPYNKNLIAICRKMKKVFFDFEKKVWSFSHVDLGEFTSLLTKNDLEFTLDDDLIQIYTDATKWRVIGRFDVYMNDMYRELGGKWDRNGRHWELSIDKLDTLVSQLLREKTAHSVHSLDGRPSYK
jgi:hypothetical protein